MLTRQYELAIPMGGLFGVSFYNVTAAPTKDGYQQEPLDGYSLPWIWYVSRLTGECVKAFLINRHGLFCDGIRVLASSIGDGAAVYDVPAGMMLVHDLGRIWASTPEIFDAEYYPVIALVIKIPGNSQG